MYDSRVEKKIQICIVESCIVIVERVVKSKIQINLRKKTKVFEIFSELFDPPTEFSYM